MGSSCSCEDTCYRSSWTDLKARLQAAAQQRRMQRCRCVNRRPKCLKIRRRTGCKEKKVKFQKCTCTPHVCCSAVQDDMFEESPVTPKNVCRFTVDAYFA